MKKFKSIIITALLALILVLPSANASVISNLVEETIPSPFLVVSSTYEPFTNQIIFDLKILNIPEDFPVVDIYMFLKGIDVATGDKNELAAVKNPLTDLIPGDETELPESNVYFISFGLLGLTASIEEATFVPNINLADLAAQMGTKDVIVPGFAVDASIIPNIKNGRYVVYLALVEKAEEDQLIASAIDLVEVIRDIDIIPEIDKCDTNGDGFVDKEEAEQCVDIIDDSCDFDNNGMVDEWEAKYCGCDFNEDGIVNEEEQQQCDEIMHDDQDPMFIEKCDTNGDGFVDKEEAEQCAEIVHNDQDQMFIDKCDANGDGFVDKEEAEQCKLTFIDQCDINDDGFVDETEKQQCAEEETSSDGGLIDLLNTIFGN